MAVNEFGLALLLPAAALILLIVLTLYRGRSVTLTNFSGLLFAALVYSFGYSMELMSRTLPLMMFWVRLEYIGIVAIPVFWLFFALCFTGNREWLNPVRVLLISAIPAFVLFAVFTNHMHHLYYLRTWVKTDGPIPMLGFERGPVYWMNTVYLNLAIMAGNALFLHRYLTARPPYRNQALTGLVSSMFPWVGHIVYVAGGTPWHLDVSTYFITFACAGLLIGVLKYRMFEVLPVAHARVFREMGTGVLVVDAEHRLLEANPLGRSCLGIDESLYGRKLGTLETPLARAVAAMLDSGADRDEYSGHRGDDPVWFDIAISNMEDRKGRAMGWIVTLRDVSENRRAEQERFELERRILLSGKTESLGLMAAGIAHDYNNLLQVVLGNLDLVLRKLGPDTIVRDYLDDASRATRRAADLTHEILAFSGKAGYLPRDCDMNEEFARVVDSLSRTASEGIRIEFAGQPGLPPVKSDPRQLAHICTHLVTNAIEALDEKPGTITVTTSVELFGSDRLADSVIVDKPLPGEYAVLTVRDDGPGMSSEVRARAFDPFFTTKMVGRGLGLSALMGIVRSHRGAILLESAPGRGTTIRVLLPLIVRPAERVPQHPVSGRIHRDGGIVLLVDDEAPVREVSKRMLKLLGFTPVAVRDGREAVDWLASHPGNAELVLLDLLMPGMDGYDTFACLRELEPQLKIILCSGYSEMEATLQFAGKHLSGFVQKPFTIGELEDEIRKVLGS